MRPIWVAVSLLSLVSPLFARVIRLQVLDQQRRPVPKATVWVVPCDAHGAFLTLPQPLSVDAEGCLRLVTERWMTGLWEGTHLRFWAVKGQKRSAPQVWSPALRELPEVFYLALRDAHPLSLTVRVVNEKGQPVNQAWAILYRPTMAKAWQMVGAWRTDALGVASVQALTLSAFEGQQFLTLAYHLVDGWAWTMLDDKTKQIRLALTSSQPTNLTVRDCFGDVVQGLMGRLVLLQTPDLPTPLPLPAFAFAFRSDEKGQFILPLPSKSQGFWEWSRRAPWGLRAFQSSLQLEAGSTRTIQFHWQTVQVSGRLLNAQTGKPLVGETVSFGVRDPMASTPALTYCSHTDRNGYFVVRSKPSRVAFSWGALLLPDGTRLPLWEENLSLPPLRCQRWDIGVLRLSPPVATVTGKVMDPKGHPLPFAFVQARGEGLPNVVGWQGVRVKECNEVLWRTKTVHLEPSHPFAFTFADRNGNFTLSLRAGKWRLIALRSGPPHRPPFPPPQEGSILLPAGFGLLLPKVPEEKAEPLLTVAPKAKLKVTLTAQGWDYIGASD